ncbi:MAG: fatty-acid--CoA ligase [Actinobacteria bacterium 13_2_20CM_2_72_6]|nr:MAG: fatty-acid--CoA ligase [Actinobacteria bacterium 13_2_20CM_2_72_6]
MLTGDTLGACLTQLARRYPGAAAVFPPADERTTAGDVQVAATGAAHAFRAAGVAPGAVVGVLMLPAARLLTSLFGLWRAGAAVSILPMQTGFGNEEAAARRLARIARAAGMRHLVIDAGFQGIGAALRTAMPELTLLDPPAGGSVSTKPLPEVPPEALAVVQFTSGSTSHPKGVMLSHRTMVAGLTAVVVSGRLTPEDVIVQWVPTFHDMGLVGLMSSWLNGSDVHVFTPTAFLRRPAAVLEHFAAAGGTILSGPNFSYDYLLDAVRPERLAALDLSRWRLAFNGSEPVSADTVERFAAILAPYGVGPSVMYPVYGMAEATLAVAFPEPGTVPRIVTVDRDELSSTGVVRQRTGGKRVLSVGRAVHGVQLRIVAPDGVPVGEGRLGEIQISGPSLTTGYYREFEATRQLFDGSWLRTGDLGFRLDADLFVTGRRKEMVVVRGQNFFPDDVESIAREVPGVYRRRCVAFSDVDADGTEHVGVIVEATGTSDELRREVARRISAELDLAAVRVHVVRPRWLTRTTSGKWQRGLASHRLAAERAAAMEG